MNLRISFGISGRRREFRVHPHNVWISGHYYSLPKLRRCKQQYIIYKNVESVAIDTVVINAFSKHKYNQLWQKLNIYSHCQTILGPWLWCHLQFRCIPVELYFIQKLRIIHGRLNRRYPATRFDDVCKRSKIRASITSALRRLDERNKP